MPAFFARHTKKSSSLPSTSHSPHSNAMCIRETTKDPAKTAFALSLALSGLCAVASERFFPR